MAKKKKRVIRLRVIEDRNARDQSAFCAFHTFLVEVQTNAGYILPRMRNNNLEIRIAGDKRSPQLNSQNAVCITLSPPPQKGAGSDANSLAD